ncbi:MAG: hypothetical protein RBR95_11655 [Ignavibacteriaceae bacterium]|nr:hypothetical protein [Ignavibacteriaceae bacterium]
MKKKRETAKDAAIKRILNFMPGKFFFSSSRMTKSEKKIIGPLVL